jgi:hypothetical protein
VTYSLEVLPIPAILKRHTGGTTNLRVAIVASTASTPNLTREMLDSSTKPGVPLLPEIERNL